jgi:hypothetical protein
MGGTRSTGGTEDSVPAFPVFVPVICFRDRYLQHDNVPDGIPSSTDARADPISKVLLMACCFSSAV